MATRTRVNIVNAQPITVRCYERARSDPISNAAHLPAYRSLTSRRYVQGKAQVPSMIVCGV